MLNHFNGNKQNNLDGVQLFLSIADRRHDMGSFIGLNGVDYKNLITFAISCELGREKERRKNYKKSARF